jgi:type II secretory pathway pseudopilin PulG
MLLVAALCVAAGCQRDTPSAPSAANIAAADTNAIAGIARTAELRSQLPPNTYAYIRLPSGWNLARPDGRPLDSALATQAHVDLIAKLKRATAEDPLIEQAGMRPIALLLFADWAGPVEIAFVDAAGYPSLASMFLMAMPLALDSVDALNARIAALGKDSPILEAPLNAEGRGRLIAQAMPNALRFDAEKRMLYVLSGFGADDKKLTELLSAGTREAPASMAELEQGIDPLGNGAFAWMDLTRARAMLFPVQSDSAPINRDFLDHLEAAAAGWGTVDGRGRLRVAVRAPQARWLRYLAVEPGRADFTTRGATSVAASLHLPSHEQIQAFIDDIGTNFGAEAATEYARAMANAGALKLDTWRALMETFGPELIGFSDSAGGYVAVRVRDWDAHRAAMTRFAEAAKAPVRTLSIEGVSVQSISIPSWTSTALDETLAQQAASEAAQAAQAQTSAMLRLYGRIGTHLYWVEDGDYLLFGGVPQALVDRARAESPAPLAPWLAAHGHDLNDTVVGLTYATQDVHRAMYYAYLGMLNTLADALGADVDLTGMPSASALGLPRDGAFGLALRATAEQMSVDLVYEQSPLEGLTTSQAGGMTTVAMIGILAAIAIPAYDDYTQRAKVAQALSTLGAAKVAIAEYAVAQGRLPLGLVQAGVDEFSPPPGIAAWSFVDGELRVVLADPPSAGTGIEAQDTVVLRAEYAADRGVPQWTCGVFGTTVNQRHLPSACRGNIDLAIGD